MATPLPADPYAALGVSRNADSATIKSAYRKLALKCHPDKVTDESQKPQKQEEFHKIQQAYELIGEEEKRAIYDAEVKLDQLRREKLSRTAASGPSVDIRTTGYGVRTQAPAGTAAHMDARGPSRYDVPKSSSRHADEYYDKMRSRQHDTYDPYPKHSSTSRTPRTEREKESRSSRTTSDRTRSDEKKTRDKDERRERIGKYGPFVHMEEESSSGDDKVRFEGGYRRRNEEEEARKKAAEARRRADEARTRSYDEPRKYRSSDEDDHRKYKISTQESEAMNHIGRTKYEADRPSPSRTTSSREVPQYYVRKSDRPEAVRRSSAQRKEHPSSSGRDSLSSRIKERIPEIVEWGNHEEKKVPSMPHAKSSPAEIQVPRATPQRSYTTESVSHSRHGETSPTPTFGRANTMPHVSSSSSRRKEATVPRASGLRNAENAGDSGYSSSSPPLPSYGTVPSTTTRKIYYQTNGGGGVSLLPEDIAVANGHRTVFREPGSTRATSPTPISRPPMGANRPAEPSSQRSATVNIPPPPPLGRSATTLSPSRGREEERGRSRKPLYGEIPTRDPVRENRQPTTYSPDRVAYARKYGPEDVRWSRGRDPAAKDHDYDYVKPSMQRSTTYAY